MYVRSCRYPSPLKVARLVYRSRHSSFPWLASGELRFRKTEFTARDNTHPLVLGGIWGRWGRGEDNKVALHNHTHTHEREENLAR